MQLTSIKVRVSFLCVRVQRSAIQIDRVDFTHYCKVNTNEIKAFVKTTITVELVETLVDGARFTKLYRFVPRDRIWLIDIVKWGYFF